MTDEERALLKARMDEALQIAQNMLTERQQYIEWLGQDRAAFYEALRAAANSAYLARRILSDGADSLPDWLKDSARIQNERMRQNAA